MAGKRRPSRVQKDGLREDHRVSSSPVLEKLKRTPAPSAAGGISALVLSPDPASWRPQIEGGVP